MERQSASPFILSSVQVQCWGPAQLLSTLWEDALVLACVLGNNLAILKYLIAQTEYVDQWFIDIECHDSRERHSDTGQVPQPY